MMRVRRNLAIAVAVASLMAIAGCSDGQVQRTEEGSQQAGYVSGDGVVSTYSPDERLRAPEFSGPLLDGGTFNLASAKPDVVVLNVWGSWCPPCRKEAPDLQAVYEATAPQGVRFVGINTRDTKVAARAFEDEFGITYPSVFDPKGTALLAFRSTLPPEAIPSTLVIDREGKIAARVIGAISRSSLEQIVSDVASAPRATGEAAGDG